MKDSSAQTSMPPPVSFTQLACPPKNDALWHEHPRVFLVPDQDGKARCPYCGRKHQLPPEHRGH